MGHPPRPINPRWYDDFLAQGLKATSQIIAVKWAVVIEIVRALKLLHRLLQLSGLL